MFPQKRKRADSVHIFVTGGAGFIGSNFIRLAFETLPGARVTNFDLLTYAGNPANLSDISDRGGYRFVKGDVADRDALSLAISADKPDAIVHFAAESHVDRSLADAGIFVRTNVLGTENVIECVRHFDIEKLLHISTAEAYGALPDACAPPFMEDSPLKPRNPYSASKAGADHLAAAAYLSHGLPVVITRSGNNYGPYQFPEKFVPLAITNLLEGKPIPVYGEGKNVRDWIHVRDHCRALILALLDAAPGSVYNVGPGGGKAVSNMEIARMILAEMDCGDDMIKFVPDRPGHDFRYALDVSEINNKLGFEAEIGLAEGISETVKWYRENKKWWREIRSGEYLKYYEKMYPGV